MLAVSIVLIDAYPHRKSIGNVLLHLLSGATATLSVLVILFTRLHYTADVVVAILISLWTWYGYYQTITNPLTAETQLVRAWERDRHSLSGCCCCC